MMITLNHRSWIAALAVAVLLVASLSAQESPTDPIASIHAGPSRVEWVPQADHERLTLTVTGPGDFAFQREFAAGKAPSLSLLDENGERLPEGSYAWELRAQPRLDAATREALTAAREAGDEASVEKLRNAASLPGRPLVQSGYLTIDRGGFTVAGGEEGGPRAPLGRATEKETIPEDLFVEGNLDVQGGACIGAGCNEGDALSDGLVIKSQWPALVFEDVFDGLTPDRDWAIVPNGFASGVERFAIFDIDGNGEILKIIGGAPANSLYIRDNGNLGLGTETPSQDVHVISTNSPAVRLEQTLGGGLSARSWDVLGNDVGFSIRDVTNSSAVPFRIRAGAPGGSVEVAANGDVGIGTTSPAERLHIYENTNANSYLVVENTNTGTEAGGFLRAKSDTAILNFQAHGSGRTLVRFGQTLGSWAEFLQPQGNGLIIGTLADKPLILGTNNSNRMHITGGGSVGIGTASPSSLLHVNGGDIRVSGGSFIDDGTTLNVPDYVFEPGYDLMPLEDLREFIARERHLPNVPPADEVKALGLNLGQSQMRLLEKIEELTLYTLEQDERLRAQNEEMQSLRQANRDLEARLAALEQALVQR